MRLLLLAVGRMKRGPERDLLSRYADRTRMMVRQHGIAAFDIVEFDESRARTADERKREEAHAIEAQIPPGARTIVLDERGRPIGSEDFAADMARARDTGTGCFGLVIGGPDGVSDIIRHKADLCIGYGSATFPHQIVRVLAAEQIYRALTILSGHPYHRA